MLNKAFKTKLMRILFSAPLRRVKELKLNTKTADAFKKRLPKLNWNSALWRHCSLEHCCASASVSRSFGKVFVLNTNSVLANWLRSAPCSETIIRLFLAVCLSNCGLTAFHREVKKNCRYHVFFEVDKA